MAETCQLFIRGRRSCVTWQYDTQKRLVRSSLLVLMQGFYHLWMIIAGRGFDRHGHPLHDLGCPSVVRRLGLQCGRRRSVETREETQGTGAWTNEHARETVQELGDSPSTVGGVHKRSKASKQVSGCYDPSTARVVILNASICLYI